MGQRLQPFPAITSTTTFLELHHWQRYNPGQDAFLDSVPSEFSRYRNWEQHSELAALECYLEHYRFSDITKAPYQLHSQKDYFQGDPCTRCLSASFEYCYRARVTRYLEVDTRQRSLRLDHQSFAARRSSVYIHFDQNHPCLHLTLSSMLHER